MRVHGTSFLIKFNQERGVSMSYNPYLYGGNPYQNLAQQQQIQYYQNQLQQLEQQQQAQAQMQNQIQNPVQAQNGIIGKYIGNAEEITVSDVPMNGRYSIFPKNDMSEIYAKAWDGNGNIQTVVYRPYVQENQQNNGQDITANAVNVIDELQTFKQEIMARFDALEKTGKAEVKEVKGDK